MSPQEDQSIPMVDVAATAKCVALVSGTESFGLNTDEMQFVDKNTDAGAHLVVFRGVDAFLKQSTPLTYSMVVIGSVVANEAVKSSLPHAAKVLVAGGKLVICSPVDTKADLQLGTQLLLGGFVDEASAADSTGTLNITTAKTPVYQSSGALLPKRKEAKIDGDATDSKKAGVWKLMAGDVVDDELADEDALLDGDDVAAGNGTASATDCTPDTKKRACKDCSCGLKEIQSGEAVVSDEDLKKSLSGCGSCAKGDAFRCGGCPYLGTPTFTPGTKPEIAIKPDGSKVLLDMSSDI